MQILSVRFKNVCQMRDLAFTLSPGMNAFIGPNGSGKSNTLKGIYAALTNDWSRNAGSKEMNICQSAGPKEKSEIELVFQHHGATYRLLRQLRPNKQELIIPGEDPITRDALVNARVAQILGISTEILDHYVFIDQWAMFDFLTVTDTERAKAFARLFGTLEAERTWQAVGEVLNSIEVPQVLADLDNYRLELQQTLRRIDELDAQLAEFADLPERPDPNDDKDTRAIREAHRRRVLDNEIEQIERRLRILFQDLADKEQERVGFASDLENLRQAQCGGQEAVEAAKAALANWQVLKGVQQSRARIEQQLERVESEAVLKKKPSRCGLYVSDLDGPFHERHDFLEAEIARLEKFVKSFDPVTGVAECPTCYTPAVNLREAVEKAKRALPDLKKEYEDKHSRIEYSRRIDQEEREYYEWYAGWSQRVESLRKQVADLKTVPRPDHDEETLKQIVAEAMELDQAIKDVENELNGIDREIATLQGRVQSDERRLAEARAERDSLPVYSPEELASIEQRIAARAAAFETRARLRGERQSEQRHLKSLQDSIAMLEGRRAEADRVRNWVRHLTEIREVLHRDNLPRIVAQHYLRELQIDTNAFLDVFEAPFRVETDEKLSFRAVFHDGRNQPAARLSGGEKVVLALAFRLSVNSMFAQDVGLLCLDEPTVGLDEHNLSCLKTALERLKELTRSRGLQVILVTHERGIGHLFDKVIDMSVTS